MHARVYHRITFQSTSKYLVSIPGQDPKRQLALLERVQHLNTVWIEHLPAYDGVLEIVLSYSSASLRPQPLCTLIRVHGRPDQRAQQRHCSSPVIALSLHLLDCFIGPLLPVHRDAGRRTQNAAGIARCRAGKTFNYPAASSVSTHSKMLVHPSGAPARRYIAW